ncbi:hypothetical protein KFK09_007446 [Dendrobium nobile]|uniref:Uncharacterized protein n=1 Tax=Dendrobium nobile TaxID=94219 RepID=A0A8T3BWI8_DENNO|nr:hypothetical protein KFK09_007446 [Dendrobium nobile]
MKNCYFDNVLQNNSYANSALYFGMSCCQFVLSVQLVLPSRIILSIYLQTYIPQSKEFCCFGIPLMVESFHFLISLSKAHSVSEYSALT